MFRYVGSSALRAFVLKGNSLPFYDGFSLYSPDF